jgi:hypothetical protein
MRSSTGQFVQGGGLLADVGMAPMTRHLTYDQKHNPVDRRRTMVALFSASVISLVVWGLVVVLNIH